MNSCINNTIQVYLELLIKEFSFSDKELKKLLYDRYKNIRTTIAEKGCLEIKDQYDNAIYMTNPKTIASCLFYLFCVMGGTGITQKQIAKAMGISVGGIRKNYRSFQSHLMP